MLMRQGPNLIQLATVKAAPGSDRRPAPEGLRAIPVPLSAHACYLLLCSLHLCAHRHNAIAGISLADRLLLHVPRWILVCASVCASIYLNSKAETHQSLRLSVYCVSVSAHLQHLSRHSSMTYTGISGYMHENQHDCSESGQASERAYKTDEGCMRLTNYTNTQAREYTGARARTQAHGHTYTAHRLFMSLQSHLVAMHSKTQILFRGCTLLSARK